MSVCVLHRACVFPTVGKQDLGSLRHHSFSADHVYAWSAEIDRHIEDIYIIINTQSGVNKDVQLCQSGGQ